MARSMLFHDASREIVSGFLDDTIARLGWWAAQAWWAEGDGLVAQPWTIGDGMPAELHTMLPSDGGALVHDSGARYLRPTRLPLRELACFSDRHEALVEQGITHAVVYDVPGKFDLDVRLVLVPPVDVTLTQTIIDSLESSARLMPTVIRQEKERRDLSHGATHDPLTGLLNRRGLDHALESASTASALRALIFLDLDEYKSVNDTHGHLVGDEVLVDVATQLSLQIRPADVLARIGGDEFVMIANPVAGADGALVVAHRLLSAISRDLISSTGATVSIAASVGVALWHPGQELVEALHSADSLMYEAKRFGGGIASEDASGRIVITDAYSETYSATELDRGRSRISVESILGIEGSQPWGQLVTLPAELSAFPASRVIAMIGDTMEAEGLGRFATGHLIVELTGLGWSRGDQLGELVAAFGEVISLHRIDLLLGANATNEALRLALAEARARYGIGVVMTCAGTASNPLGLVEADQPRALVLSSEIVSGLDAERPRTTLVRMIAAVADVLGIPIIARGTPSPEATAVLVAAGCTLIADPRRSVPVATQLTASAPITAAGHLTEETS